MVGAERTRGVLAWELALAALGLGLWFLWTFLGFVVAGHYEGIAEDHWYFMSRLRRMEEHGHSVWGTFTAGFNVHGFADYRPGQSLPDTVQILEGSGPAKNDRVRLTFTPGDHMDYSGGGITVSQLVVEDVTGMPYEDAARKYVFEPLGMNRSTFVNPLPASHGNIANAHDGNGRPAAPPRGWEAMPEQAASGLWTSARDLATFVLALLDDSDDAFLPPDLREDMLTRVPQSWHGLGPRLNGEGETRVFHHGGANNSYRARIEGRDLGPVGDHARGQADQQQRTGIAHTPRHPVAPLGG